MNPTESSSAPGPGPRKAAGLPSRAYELFVSPRLAIALLVGVLACCVVGVTVLRGERAWTLIFGALWFNGLLVLLALSSGAAFFSRIWRRKASLISVGMIVFHLSFVALLGGVVYNALFHFRGVLRLTEGETLANGEAASYDSAETGLFFDFGQLRGETTLVKLHMAYKVDGQDKRAAYEIAVGDGASRSTGTIYMTQNLDHGGVRYLVSKEGYSIGVVLLDEAGEERYAAMVPLQSLAQPDGSYRYTTGTAEAPGAFPFPAPPEIALYELGVRYVPKGGIGREGEVEFEVWELGAHAGAGQGGQVGAASAGKIAAGKVPVGGIFEAGAWRLEAREVRYWVGMAVRRDPGLPVILSSLWAGLAGVTMTFIGRILQDAKRGRGAASNQEPVAGPPEGNP